MKILFIGSNPSESAGSTVAFWQDTSSAKVLAKWIDELGPVDQLFFNNVSPFTTPNNRPLTTTEIRESSERLKMLVAIHDGAKIVALGRTAEKALRMIGEKFYAMPHPSGKNRKLNDKAYVEEKIKGLRNYLKPSKD